MKGLWNTSVFNISKLSSKQDVRGTKTEHPTIGTTNQGQAQTNFTVKQDNVTIKGLQANVSIPKVSIQWLKYFHEKGEYFLVFKPLCLPKRVLVE